MMWKNREKLFRRVENRCINGQPQIMVTGAAGFIGRRVVAQLAAAGAKVVAVDRAPRPANVPQGVEFSCADLSVRPDAIPPAADILVHLAWSLDRAEAAGQAQAAADFARLLATCGCRGVVGLGSAEEYGAQEGCLSENQAPGPELSPYGRAKHEACRALEAWTAGVGRKAIWLRPFVVYGPGQGGDMVVPYALRCARERRPAEFSEGTQNRDFIHVDDVAAGIVRAVEKLAGMTSPFAVCNLGRGVPVRLRDVLERIAGQTGAEGLFRFGARPMRAGEPQVQYADVATAEQWLDWRAGISWEQGVDVLCREAAR